MSANIYNSVKLLDKMFLLLDLIDVILAPVTSVLY